LTVLASVGSVDRDSTTNVRRYANLYIWLNSATGNHPDIAIFRLAQSVTFNINIQPIRLPTKEQALSTFEGFSTRFAGWGISNEGVPPRYLQYGDFRFVSNAECDFDANLMCCTASSPNLVLSGQTSDSGGPYFIYESNVPTLVGVYVGRQTGGGINYHRATRVTSYLSFISEMTGLALR